MKKLRITDFHAHILPGADHGSDSLETTRQQLKILSDRGVERVVATPHFYPQRDSVESFLERRDNSERKLASVEKGERPRVCIGAEVLVCAGIDHMPGLSKLCIRGTDVILLEMPFCAWREEHIEAVIRISRSGLVPVMAHIDRYPTKNIERLCSECNVLYQLNAEVMGTAKGRKKADRLCSSLHVVAVGSDIHGADKRAAKRLYRFVSKLEKKGVDVMDATEALLSHAEEI